MWSEKINNREKKQSNDERQIMNHIRLSTAKYAIRTFELKPIAYTSQIFAIRVDV